MTDYYAYKAAMLPVVEKAGTLPRDGELTTEEHLTLMSATLYYMMCHLEDLAAQGETGTSK